jgi:hypothetical protein
MRVRPGWLEIAPHPGIAAAHEFAVKRKIGGPLILMIGQILEREIGIIDEEPIARITGFVSV